MEPPTMTEDGRSIQSKKESRMKELLGFGPEDFRSLETVSRLLHVPRDGASLGVFRLLFGFSMVHDIMNERHMGDIVSIWNSNQDCHFPLFDFLKPLPLNWMYVVYIAMLIGALGIGLGFFFRYTVWLFVVPYWYIFFLDKTDWNNHSYLYGLTSFLLAFTSANHYISLDLIMFPDKKDKHVPLWNYSLLRTQVFVVYFIAGLKKWNDMDWMMGWSMGKLSRHWVFAPFTAIFPEEVVNFFMVHLGGATLDLLGGWMMLLDKTRPVGIFVIQQFHLMNAQMFSIGMFPYVMLCTTPLFCYADWPRKRFFDVQRLWAKLRKYEVAYEEKQQKNSDCLYPKETVKPEEKQASPDDPLAGGDTISNSAEKTEKAKAPTLLRSNPTKRHNTVSFLVMAYIFMQFFLPYSHFITRGYNSWTDGLYGYSWDMMIKTWSTQHLRVSFDEVGEKDGEVGYLNPDAITHGSGKRWNSHPDMVKQFARCVQRKFADYNITDFKLHIDVWRSMTSRFQQRMFDPRVDILTADWSPFSTPTWVMPLLADLSDWRGRLKEIHKQYYSSAEDMDELMPTIVFAADFPGLYLENYVQEGLDNTTVELMAGAIEVEFLGPGDDEDADEKIDNEVKATYSQLATKGENVTLDKPGQRLKLPQGEYHRIHTIGTESSCYMFIYENTTEKMEYKKIMAFRKMFDKMANASRDEPEKAYNFSDAAVVAQFHALPETHENIPKLVEKWTNKTLSDIEKNETLKNETRISGYVGYVGGFLKHKFFKQMDRYGRAFSMAGYALMTIWEGQTMEDFMTQKHKEMVEEEERKNNASAAAANVTTDNQQASNDNQQALTDDQQALTDDQQAPTDDQQAPTDNQQAPTDNQQAQTDNQQAQTDNQ